MSIHYSFQPDSALLDIEAFTAQLDEAASLANDQTTSSQAPPPVALFRSALQTLREGFDQHFLAGADIRDLVYGRAWAMDQLLACAWRCFNWPDDHIALLAVGGYGRGELHPGSDIDLLILLEQDDDTAYREAITAFITFLWDLRLDIGHSVRSLNDCEREARGDITVATNLLENRTIVGPDRLRAAMDERLGSEHMWPSAEFFEAKWQEQIARHAKYNNSEYHLEPNIKSSPGGLRDIQMIGWVAKRHFGAQTFDDLVEEGFINEAELRLLTQGQCVLWQIRYGLHMIASRAEDRLLFDYQIQLARMFEYADNEQRLAVEQFMKRYFRVVMMLTELNDVLLQHFEEVILESKQAEIVQPLNRRFQLRNQHIEAIDPDVFAHQPFALIEIFLLMAQRDDVEGVRASTIRAIRDHRHLIDESFRQDLRNTSLFMELLRSSGNVALQLSRMSRYGVLGKYLPDFGRAVGMMQHDLFHVYTVDAHTLRLLKFLHDFRHTCHHDERYPVASEVIQQLPKLELVYIAGLFHDLAKGRGGDHSLLGGEVVVDFCERHHISRRDTRLVRWLVEQHLVMSMTAQKKDISDPDVIADFAALVKNQMRLDYLYVLTVADINATNPKLWNGWRAALLHQLYSETKRALRRGLENPIDREEWVEETRQEALSVLNAMGADTAKVWSLWDNLGEDYFLQVQPSEVAWQTLGILQHKDDPNPLILVAGPSEDMREGSTKVFVYMRDVAFIFAATAAALDQLGLSIHDARITTSDNGYTLNTFIVLEPDGTMPRDPARLAEIRQVLFEALDDPEDFPDLVRHHTPRQLKHFTLPTQVNISNDPVNFRTLVEVISPDRPGLLARIGRIFMEYDLWLQNAKIATLGERVEDVFFITLPSGEPLSDPEICQQLQNRLCDELDREARQ
ncbi:[protein-PII] uridylyltransferase [Terasakiispira papahanaumokuakeensis]